VLQTMNDGPLPARPRSTARAAAAYTAQTSCPSTSSAGMPKAAGRAPISPAVVSE